MKSKTLRTKISARIFCHASLMTLMIIGCLQAGYAQATQNVFRPQPQGRGERSGLPDRALPRIMQRHSETSITEHLANSKAESEPTAPTNQVAIETASESSRIKWKQTNGPETGIVVRVLATGNMVLAATTGGIFYSQDGGRNWRYAEQGPDSQIYGFQKVGNAVFANDTSFSNSKGVWRSTDNGKSWTPSSNGLPVGAPVQTLGAVGNTLVATVFPGLIYRSLDFGANWELASTGLPEGIQYGRFASIGATLLLGSTSSPTLFRSTDNAATWTPVALTLPAEVTPFSVGVSGNRFFVGTTGAGAFYSDDLGATWHKMTNGLPADSFADGWDAIGALIYVINNTGDLYVSSNQGNSWELRLAGFATAKGIYNFAGSGNGLLAATSDGVIRSTDQGRSWKRSNNGLRAAEIFNHEAIGRHWFVGTYGGGFWRSSDQGASWTQINKGITGTDFQGKTANSIIALGRTLIAGTSYAGNDGNCLYRSDDLGETWTPLTSVSPLGFGVVNIFKAGNDVYVSLYGAMIVSKDRGQSFQSVSGLPQDQFYFSILKTGPTLFIASYDSGVYRSDDTGVQWSKMNDGLTPNALYTNSLTAVGGSIFLGTYDGLYRSDNHGYYWYAVGVPDVQDVKNIGQTLFASTYGYGIFTSDDGGQTWTNSSNGLVGRREFKLLRSGDQMAVSSSGHGVFLTNSLDH